ncbi:MAG: PHP domain-containing protein, partial [Muribaculaceae bacterium]
MKNLIIIAATASLAFTAAGQSIYYQDHNNVDMARHTLRDESMRHEFVIPKVDGYTVLKADLHCHTVYSDASTTPEYRVLEAWTDGLDVLAITDHVEYRRWEPTMLKFLKGYLPADTKAVNHNVIGKAADKSGIQADLNVPYNAARKEAEAYGITIIPGVEITRSPETIGHYNALFVEDANTIYDADPAQSMRNARSQGALIMHNHPGWRRTSLEMTEFEKQVYAEHLID